jgi:uncharacterized membrane protein YwzB
LVTCRAVSSVNTNTIWVIIAWWTRKAFTFTESEIRFASYARACFIVVGIATGINGLTNPSRIEIIPIWTRGVNLIAYTTFSESETRFASYARACFIVVSIAIGIYRLALIIRIKVVAIGTEYWSRRLTITKSVKVVARKTTFSVD